jgi:hypothetical protein
MPHMLPMKPNTIGLLAKGTTSSVNKGILQTDEGRERIREYADITRAPENIPPTPMPAIALPTIKAVLDGAVAHIREPSSKMLIAIRNVPLIYTGIDN